MIEHLLDRVNRRGTGASLAGAGWRPRRDEGRSLWRYRLVSVAIVAVVWEVFAIAANSLLIPTFSETVVAMATLLADLTTWQALVATNVALAIGLTISIVVGIPVGFWMGRSRTVAAAVKPYVTILLVAPMAALIPLVVMAVGIGLASRVILVMLFAVPMIVVNAHAGVRGADQTLLDMGRTFGASERQLWLRVLWPGSLPAVMAGIRIGLGRAITAMILAELLLLAVGLGGLILRYRSAFRADMLYATTVLIVIEALILIGIAQAIERRATPWSEPREGVGR